MLKVLLNNDVLGPLSIESADPIGINEVVFIIKRSDDFDGVVFEVDLDLEFIETGRAYIQQAFETAGGVDAEVFLDIFEYDPNKYEWVPFRSGQIAFSKYELSDTKVVVNADQTGFQRRTMNLIDTDIDLQTTVSNYGSSLPVNKGVFTDVTYHSKAILKELNAKPSDGSEYQQVDVLGENYPTCATFGGCVRGFDQKAYGQVEFGKQKLAELEGIFTLPYGYSKDGAFPMYQALEAGVMDINLQVRLKHSVTALVTGGDIDFCGGSTTDIGNKEVFGWFKHTDKDDNVITEANLGQWVTNIGCGGTGAVGDFETKTYSDTSVNINIGDKIYVYFTFRIFGNYEQNNGGSSGRIDYTLAVTADPEETFIRLVQKTVAEPSQVKTIMIYEAIERCVQFYSGQVDCFRSTLLGRTDILGPTGSPLYAEDGEYSLMGITNGNNLRGIDKPILEDLQSLLEFVNAVACIGFGFKIIDGKQYFVLERRQNFYDVNLRAISLKNVPNIKVKVNMKRIANLIQFGYEGKLDIGTVNAIDEINTQRTYRTPVVNTKTKIIASTKMRTSGYQIEFQRRLTESTKESKLDDENFAVVLLRDGDTFKTKRNEGYVSITGVFSPETIYNVDITPRRNLENWKPFIATSVIRSINKVLTFASGEVNYTATTRKNGEATALAENGPIDLTNVSPILDHVDYSFSMPISREELTLLRLNSGGYVEIQDEYGVVGQGFISPKGVQYTKEEETAEFDLIKLYRKQN
jgi:hypothetical protein